MPGRSTNPAAQIADCRRDLDAMTATWRAVARRSAPRARIEAEVLVFNQMAVALHGWCHPRSGLAARSAADALTELRLLALGVLANGGYFPSDPSVFWRPEASITGYRAGDRIALTEALFSRLTETCLAGLATECVA